MNHLESEEEEDELIGSNVGNYVVKSQLGEGGMGAVYLAEHPLIGKKVALKVLHPELSSKKEVVERFFHEAKAVNDIQHPNIVDIIDYGVIGGASRKEAVVYFIMEFLNGRSLAEVLAEDSPLPPQRALNICLQIADALVASHANGIVHRDLKPDNIILIHKRHEPDFVKVLDFGIAKLTGDGHQSRKTRTGIVMGTPAYMSPEQCEGKGNIDHRTDVYALGILLYEMITGRVPFQGEGYGEVLVQHLTQKPEPPSTIRGVITPHVEQVILKSLEKSKDLRFPNMSEFMRALVDPVNFVEQNGGLQGFLAAVLPDTGQKPRLTGRPQSVAGHLTPPPHMMTPAPGKMMTPGQVMTPAPGQMMSPAPGQLTPQPSMIPQNMTPAPGQMIAPGQVGAPQATVFPEQKKSKTGLIIGGIAALAVIGLGVFFAMQGGGGDEKEPEQEQPVAAAVPIDAAPVKEVKVVDAAPAVEMVEITVNTEPAGALIYFGDESEPRLTGQGSFKVEKSKKKSRLRIVLDGYVEKKLNVSLKSDQTLTVELRIDKKAAAAKAEERKRLAKEARRLAKEAKLAAERKKREFCKKNPGHRRCKRRGGSTTVSNPDGVGGF